MSISRRAPPDDPNDDTALVTAARSGDRAAFAALHARFAPMVHGILLARVSPDDAPDLVQDVFLRAFRSLHTVRAPGAVGGWLAQLARNRAADFHRARKDMDRLPPQLVATPRPVAEAREALAVIRSLPQAYRESLVLRLVEGMTGPEISARLGLTPGSVRVNLSRGMRLLKERLGLEDRR